MRARGPTASPQGSWACCILHGTAVKAGLQLPVFRAHCASPLCCLFSQVLCGCSLSCYVCYFIPIPSAFILPLKLTLCFGFPSISPTGDFLRPDMGSAPPPAAPHFCCRILALTATLVREQAAGRTAQRGLQGPPAVGISTDAEAWLCSWKMSTAAGTASIARASEKASVLPGRTRTLGEG